jgi:DNA-binding transcriptional MerR regulator
MKLKKLYDDMHCLTNSDLDIILSKLNISRIGNKTRKVEKIINAANNIGRCFFQLINDNIAETLNLNTINIEFENLIELKSNLSNYYFGKEEMLSLNNELFDEKEISERKTAPFTKSEFLELTDVSIKTLKQWYEIGYISFNFLDFQKFNTYHIKEVRFIKKLKDQVISHDYLIKMLNKLSPPFIYSLKEIYWDFDDERWKSKPDIKKKLEDEEFFLPQFYQEIREMAEEGNLDPLYELNNKVPIYFF